MKKLAPTPGASQSKASYSSSASHKARRLALEAGKGDDTAKQLASAAYSLAVLQYGD